MFIKIKNTNNKLEKTKISHIMVGHENFIQQKLLHFEVWFEIQHNASHQFCSMVGVALRLLRGLEHPHGGP